MNFLLFIFLFFFLNSYVFLLFITFITCFKALEDTERDGEMCGEDRGWRRLDVDKGAAVAIH